MCRCCAQHGLITDRPVVQGLAKDGELVEIFEWESVEKSRGAPAIAEIGNHWKAMSEVMDFVPMAQLAECQHAFAHFDADIDSHLSIPASASDTAARGREPR